MAGFCQSFVTAPQELLKLRIQVQRSDGAFGQAYKSPLDCARKVIKSEGGRGLLKGMLATHLRDWPAFGLYFASYEYMARRMSRDGTMESLTTWQLLLAGGIHSFIIIIVIVVTGVDSVPLL